LNSVDEISVVKKGEHVRDYDGIVREGLDVFVRHVMRFSTVVRCGHDYHQLHHVELHS